MNGKLPARGLAVLGVLCLWGCGAATKPTLPPTSDPRQSPAPLVSYGGLGPDIPFALAATSADALVTAGTFSNRAEFGAETLEAARVRDIFVALGDPDGSVSWVSSFGARAGDEPRALARGDGGSWMTGFFTDRLSSTGSGPAWEIETAGGADVFVLKLSDMGEVTVKARFGGPLADNGNAITLDADGNVLLAGSFQGEMTIGQDVLTSKGGRDIFVASLDPLGRPRWAVGFGGLGADEARGLAVGADGQIWVAGSFQTASGTGIAGLENRGASDVFVLRLTPEGRRVGQASFGGPGKDRLVGLAPLGSGVALVGDFQDKLRGNASEPLLESFGGTDVFVLFLNSQGNLGYRGQLGGTVTDQALAAAPSSRGGLLIGGYFQGRADLDPGTATAWAESPDATNSDGFVVELSATGALIGSRHLGGDGVEQVLAVTPTLGGGFAAAGLFKDGLALPWLESTVQGRGKTDIFVLRDRF